jgi:hypothetical protein
MSFSDTVNEMATNDAASVESNLRGAAELEHLLANEYLFSAFSLKKYPEEFAGHDSSNKRREEVDAQLERNRRWQGAVLYVARQEMEHLCMVQNLLAILGAPSHLWRPSFPVEANHYAIDIPLQLRAFSRCVVEGYRYIEKPDSIRLENPYGAEPAPSARTGHLSIEELYEEIRCTFEKLVDHRWIDARNYNRVVNEHFGFNIDLDPIVHGQVHKYVEAIIGRIIAQGEGVGEVPPPLGSHFMTFQKILDDMTRVPDDVLDECVLPVVPGPFRHGSTHPSGIGTAVENTYTCEAMALFDDGYQLMCRMLAGFFDHYDLDTTTGIHPPKVNAWFQTAFYPLMTMMMRPLGEILCRLPVAERPERGPNGLPTETAGPSFELRPDTEATWEDWDDVNSWTSALSELSTRASELSKVPEGVDPFDFGGNARSLSERLRYMSENLHRMGVNFERYWNDEMVTVIPSKNFQNLPGIN